MNSTVSEASYLVRLSGTLSLLAAIFACLVLWSGIVLLLNYPSASRDPLYPLPETAPSQPVAQWERLPEIYQSLADLLLLWLPIGLTAVACGAGGITLAYGQGRAPTVSRRAVIAILLSVGPGCLCTLWYLTFITAPFLRR